MHDPHTNNTTATLPVFGVKGRPGAVPVNSPAYRWSHAALYPKQCKKNMSEGRPQRTQQSHITQALLLQPICTDRVFFHLSWSKGKSQPANYSIIISPPGKLPHAFKPESYILIARSVFALNMASKKTKNFKCLKKMQVKTKRGINLSLPQKVTHWVKGTQETANS